jgi:hypothetical protein
MGAEDNGTSGHESRPLPTHNRTQRVRGEMFHPLEANIFIRWTVASSWCTEDTRYQYGRKSKQFIIHRRAVLYAGKEPAKDSLHHGRV